MKVYCKSVPFKTSFWIVSLTLILLEWASVQMKLASINLTLLSPFICLRQSAKSSADSSWQWTHGGLLYLPQFRQCWIDSCLGIPSEMSIEPLMQFMQVLDELGGVRARQTQQWLLKHKGTRHLHLGDSEFIGVNLHDWVVGGRHDSGIVFHLLVFRSEQNVGLSCFYHIYIKYCSLINLAFYTLICHQ